MADEEAAPRPASASGAVKPSDRKEWAHKSNVNMTKARHLTRDMLTKLRENDIAEAANKMAAMENASRDKEVKKKQVYKAAAVHSEVIGTSFKCMRDIEEVILQTEDSISKLRHEKYAGFASLQVCVRRLELRSKRPEAETFNDKLNDALNAEKKLLENSRKDIEQMEAEGNKIVVDVSKMRKELSRDTGERRLEMAHDFSMLRSELTAPPPPASAALDLTQSEPPAEGAAAEAEAPASPSKKEAKKEEAKKEEPKPEAAKEGDAAAEAEEPSSPSKQKGANPQRIIDETNSLLARAAEFREKSLAYVVQIKKDAKKAAAVSDDALSRRTHELAATKKKLEQHALDVDSAIVTAERALTRTEKRLDPRDKKKKEKLDGDKKLLAQLKESRLILQEDIRNKFTALEIDNMCRRVTPAKADAAQHEKTQTGGMGQRSNSTPDLRASAGKGSTNQELMSTAASASQLQDGKEMESTKLPPIEGASTS